MAASVSWRVQLPGALDKASHDAHVHCTHMLNEYIWRRAGDSSLEEPTSTCAHVVAYIPTYIRISVQQIV